MQEEGPASQTRRIRLLVLDAHAGVREAIATFVEASEDLELAGQGANLGAAARRYKGASPDVALIGMTLRGSSGIQAAAAIHRRWPKTRIIAMGGFQEEGCRQAALAAGAIIYVLKNVSADELSAAICAAYAGQPGTEAVGETAAPGRQETEEA